jgi:hypothetical protein
LSLVSCAQTTLPASVTVAFKMKHHRTARMMSTPF